MSLTLEVEQLVVDRLREWLLLKLPAQVAAVNALRPAVLKAPLAGPYTVPVGGALKYHATEVEPSSWTTVAFTSGSRTAAQLATEFNTAVGASVASADSSGRLGLTSVTPPTLGTDSLVVLGDDATGMMAVLGFDAGGERAVRAAIEAPGVKEVMDGLALQPDSNGSRFWVVLGDNASVPVAPGPRVDEYTVGINVGLCVPVPSNSSHRTREHLRAALRAVRETLFLLDSGRTLGNATGIQLVFERQCVIKSRPTQFVDYPNYLFGRANLELNVRVYERQGP